MRKRLALILAFMVTIIFIASCSQGGGNPIMPLDSASSPPITAPDKQSDYGNRILLGTWSINIDTASISAEITPIRNSEFHMNVRSYIPAPTIHINAIYPNNVIDADVTISNPYPIDVYDVRLIIFEDPLKYILINPDDWTSLYDIPGNLPINPFRAYAKTETNRKFAGQTQHTENFQVYLAPGYTYVDFAIDASYPGNCLEPYEIRNFTQGEIYDNTESSTEIGITVYDWQNNTNSVQLYCPEITGVPLLPFAYINYDRWVMELTNSMGAAAGEYVGYILALSTDSGSLALYEKIIITVSSTAQGIPDNPYLVSMVYTMPKCVNVSFMGNYAFCSCDDEGLRIMNRSNPAIPNIISQVDDITAKSCASDFNYAYVAAYSDGLLIYDILPAFRPELVGSIDTGLAVDVDVPFPFGGGYAYVADYENGFVVVNIMNPPSPHIVPNTLNLEKCREIVLKDNYAFAVSFDYAGSYLNAIDVTDPENPVLINSIEINGLQGVEIQGDYAYLPSSSYDGGLIIYNISDPSNMQRVGQISVESVQDVAVWGNNAYVTSSPIATWNHLVIVNIQDPTNPQIVSSIDMREPAKVTALGPYAYVCDKQRGLVIVDVNNPAEPEIAFCYKIDRIDSLKLAGDYAYLPCREEGLFIIDINDPGWPKMAGSFFKDIIFSDADFTGIDVVDNLAYLMDIYGYLFILDISDPSKPTELSYIDVGDLVWNIDVEGDYAYIPTEYSGLRIVDISDPYNPYVVGSTPWMWCYDVVIEGNYAFISSSNSGFNALRVVDISDVTDPVQVGYYDAFEGRGIDKQGDYVYLAHYDPCRFFEIIDVSDPTLPVNTAFAYITHMAVDVDVQGNYAYIAGFEPAGGGGLEVVDITDPSAPVLFSSLPTDGHSTGIAVKDNYAYLGDADGGLKIIQLW